MATNLPISSTVDIVETQLDLDVLLSRLPHEPMLLDIVTVDADRHPTSNSVSLLFLYLVTSNQVWCVPIQHHDAVIVPDALSKVCTALKASNQNKFVMDKKSAIQLLGMDCGFLDFSVLRYMESGTIDENDYRTNGHNFVYRNFRNIPNTNVCVPIYKHARGFYNKVETFKNTRIDAAHDLGFLFVNETMTKCFAELESNGICVNENFLSEFGDDQEKHIKNGLVFSQYNFLTSTGRPSNRFGNVNYAALNKNDGSRECFVSRYGADGMLVMMDYTAFHPRLIADLGNFPMSLDENPYAYLAKYYFEKDEVDEEDIAVSKGFTFLQIYGGIDSKWVHIPYFKAVQEYIDSCWRFFENNGYVETPRYHRKIKPCHIGDASPNKLFNYILQAFETEVAVDVLNKLLTALKGHKTVPVLYTYDSVLFDVHRTEARFIIKSIKPLMEQGKYPVKVFIGKNYKDMKLATNL